MSEKKPLEMNVTPTDFRQRSTIADGISDSSPQLKQHSAFLTRNSIDHSSEFTDINQNNRKPSLQLRRMFDGTSQKELDRASNLYLNKTGPCEYTLPAMTGRRLMLSDKHNTPSYALRSRTKLGWLPGRTVEFQGQSSPPSTLYAK